jgi:hypothetical protein
MPLGSSLSANQCLLTLVRRIRFSLVSLVSLVVFCALQRVVFQVRENLNPLRALEEESARRHHGGVPPVC